MDYNERRHKLLLHYKRKIERLVELDRAKKELVDKHLAHDKHLAQPLDKLEEIVNRIGSINEEKRQIYEHLRHPPESVLALFNGHDKWLIKTLMEGHQHELENNIAFLEESTEMVASEELLAAEKVQDARLPFDIDTGPFIPSYFRKPRWLEW